MQNTSTFSSEHTMNVGRLLLFLLIFNEKKKKTILTLLTLECNCEKNCFQMQCNGMKWNPSTKWLFCFYSKGNTWIVFWIYKSLVSWIGCDFVVRCCGVQQSNDQMWLSLRWNYDMKSKMKVQQHIINELPTIISRQ